MPHTSHIHGANAFCYCCGETTHEFLTYVRRLKRVYCGNCFMAMKNHGRCAHEEIREKHAEVPYTERALKKMERGNERQARAIRDAIGVIPSIIMGWPCVQFVRHEDGLTSTKFTYPPKARGD